MGILSDLGLKCSNSGLNPKAAAESLRPELPKKALALLLKAKVAVFLDSPSSSQGGGGGEGGSFQEKGSWAVSSSAPEPILTTCSKHNYVLCFDHAWHPVDVLGGSKGLKM